MIMRMNEKGPEFQNKGTNERNDAARKIRNARTIERTGDPYKINRTGWQYIKELGGVQHLFDYVKTLKSQTVLDIGAGTTQASSDLQESSLGFGLHFEATVLRNRPEIEKNLGKEHVHITSAEVLRGIPDASVGCVIAVFSVGYSDAPGLVAESIDRVLVPGGAVKITGYKSIFSQFYDQFERRGYDVDSGEVWGEYKAILALKPGNESEVTAEQLLRSDEQSILPQRDEL